MFYGHCKLSSLICIDEKQEWWNRAEFCQNSFPGSSVVKNLPAKQETQVSCLGRKDRLEEGMANHSNILAWRILWTEKSGRLQSMGLQSRTLLKQVNTAHNESIFVYVN